MGRLASALLLFLVLLSVANADGKFFRPKLQEATPTIPYQRAVLKFDGYEQVMLVESTLNGPPATYGWVIPLPKKPSYVKAVNPAYIDASFKYVKPRIETQSEFPFAGLVVAILYAAIALTSGLRHRGREAGMRILFFILETMLPLVLCVVLFPVFAQSKSSAMEAAAVAEMNKVDVESLGTIGSYEVSVVSGNTGEPILKWLRDHKLTVTEKDLPVISAYAKEGWVFLAAEIRKTESGSYPPHPIKAVFPTDRLIYPMRLTGIQDEPLRLELLVVSNREALIPGMESWACDNSDIKVPIGISTDQDKEIYSDWRTGEYAMAKNGMVWTYLRGEFMPEQMRSDFGVDWRLMQRSRAEVWDAAGAVNHAVGRFAIWLAGVAILVGFGLCCFSNLTNKVAGGGALITVLVSVSAAAFWYESVKKVDTVVDQSWDQRRRIERSY
jgi:Uncharacterized protein conserved in bacteria (DUF2330)